MKFGHHLRHSIHSEWARHYLSYKALKRIIKEAMASTGKDVHTKETGDLSLFIIDFINLLLSEAGKIEAFYQKEFNKCTEMCVKCTSNINE
jgi:SPX domain protein involved in polyphosphate accumulation